MRTDWRSVPGWLAAVLLLARAIPALGQTQGQAALRSSIAAQALYDRAARVRYGPDLGKVQADAALVLMQGAMELDPDGLGYYPFAVELACSHAGADWAAQVRQWISRCIGPSAPLDLCKMGIDYVLDRLESGRQQEQFLQWLLESCSGRNAPVDSYLLTRFGILVLERRNGPAAKALFTKALELDEANSLAFSRLMELAPESMDPAGYLEHLRLALQSDPLDMDTAKAFAQYAEQLELYGLAAEAYAYCADLYEYLNPGKTPPTDIYLPWVLCIYQTDRRAEAVEVADRLRQRGVVDLFLEAVAARAAARSGQSDLAERILNGAEQLAAHMASSDRPAAGVSSRAAGPRYAAWFYCFVRPDPAKALDWANQAYAAEPNSPLSAALLAYALATNAQYDWAWSLLEGNRTQIGELARAMVMLARQDRENALAALRSAIGKDPASLVAEVARAGLQAQGGSYRPRVDPSEVTARLTDRFGRAVGPRFAEPNEWLGLQAFVSTPTLRFGGALVAEVLLSNRTDGPILIGQGRVLGRIRVDVDVHGDIQRHWPGMIRTQAFPRAYLLPGRTVRAQVLLTTGQLADLLDSSPQADLRLEVTVALDQAEDRLNVRPVRLSVTRPPTVLTSQMIQASKERLSRVDLAEAAATYRLFAGLLKEQQAISSQVFSYRYRYSQWLPRILKDAVKEALANPDPGAWQLKVCTLGTLVGLQPDIELAQAVAACLTDQAWPVRMTAVYVLALQDGGFRPVLEWTARYDLHPLVRQMASVLVGAGPQY